MRINVMAVVVVVVVALRGKSRSLITSDPCTREVLYLSRQFKMLRLVGHIHMINLIITHDQLYDDILNSNMP